jgi:hypothetical protein
MIDTSGMADGVVGAFKGQEASLPEGYTIDFFVRDYYAPWVYDKIVLGSIARWKAIYLYNGYDHILSVLTNLQSLAGISPNTSVLMVCRSR